MNRIDENPYRLTTYCTNILLGNVFTVNEVGATRRQLNFFVLVSAPCHITWPLSRKDLWLTGHLPEHPPDWQL